MLPLQFLMDGDGTKPAHKKGFLCSGKGQKAISKTTANVSFVQDFLMRAKALGLGLVNWPALTNLTRWKPRDPGGALWGKRIVGSV